MKQWTRATAHGALAGLIYGLIEYAFAILAPMVRWHPCSLVPGHWLWTAIFLSIYIILGGVTGSLAAIFLRIEPSAAARVVAGLTAFALAAGRVLVRGLA